MLSFFRLPISKENLWKAEDQCTEPTFGTTPSVVFNTTTLTTNRNHVKQALVTQGLQRASLVLFVYEDLVYTGEHRNGGPHVPGGKALDDELPRPCAQSELSEEVLFQSKQSAEECMAAIEGAEFQDFLIPVAGYSL